MSILSPLLITIGPQCSGKTSFLTALSDSEQMIDICMDNVASTYLTVDLNQILEEIVTSKGIDMRNYASNAEMMWIMLLFKDVSDINCVFVLFIFQFQFLYIIYVFLCVLLILYCRCATYQTQ